MRISDWSSDVCSSDLPAGLTPRTARVYNPRLRAFRIRIKSLMANTKSAKKAVRQTVGRTARNRDRISRVRGYVRKVENAIAGGDKAAAEAAFRSAMPEMHRGVSKGVLHRNTVDGRLPRPTSRPTPTHSHFLGRPPD